MAPESTRTARSPATRAATAILGGPDTDTNRADRCHRGCDSDADSESDTGSDADDHTDSDSNTDVDSDSNTDVDSDSNTDVDSDSNTDVDSDSTGGGNAGRAIAPIGTVLLVALAVILAAGVGAATFGGTPLQDPAPSASLSLSASSDTLTIRHLAGAPLDVENVRLRVTVDGDPLAHQPPVPFFSATGFRPGPTGAFNVAGDTTLAAGETASVRVADTNDPPLTAGDRVEVAVYSDGQRIARLSTRVH